MYYEKSSRLVSRTGLFEDRYAYKYIHFKMYILKRTHMYVYTYKCVYIYIYIYNYVNIF